MEFSKYRPMVSGIPMLQDLQEKTREQVGEVLLKVAKRWIAAKGEVLYTKGAEDLGTGALLVEGALELRTGAAEPFLVEAPELLGEMQQFNEYGQRTASVTAAEDSVILEFVWEDFVGVCFSVLSKGQQIEVKNMLAKHAAARLGGLSDPPPDDGAE